MRLVGHRGASCAAPENTLAAFRAALAAGASGFELDIQLLASGEAIVLHDSTLQRTGAGVGPIAHRGVSGLGLAEVKRADVGSWFGRDWTDERVPLLHEALELLKSDERSCCLAELKTTGPFVDSKFDPRLASAAAAAARAAAVRPEQLLWITFALELALQVKRESPQHAVLLLAFCVTRSAAWRIVRTCVEHDLDGVNLYADPYVITHELVSWLRGRGKKVGAWVLQHPAHNDTPAVYEALADAGVDFFTSNLPPAVVHSWREEVPVVK